jgi:hypothetical protein
MRLEKISKDIKDHRAGMVYQLTLDEEFHKTYMPHSWLTSSVVTLGPAGEKELMKRIALFVCEVETGNKVPVKVETVK